MLTSPSRSSAWIVFVAGALITSTAAWSLRNQETSSIQAGFDAEVHEQEALILERLGRVLAGNDHLRALLRANQGMDAATFNEHVEHQWIKAVS